ncbi:hypothetical protein DFH07DRAFT_955991 [Mycena maculata]|uniref:Uncharacterized protein n=1 Tax=Mycena maculata TaxID=230809 RepID=A0AAD7JGT7_9AGAR|nr:hypothetical protein DFH07DRAFT_955991 [Mycena maculata]
MYQQSQRGQSYTFSTQEDSDTAFSFATDADIMSKLDIAQLDVVDFADCICNILTLSAKYRGDLHTFVKLVESLARDQAIPMIYGMATNYYTQQLILDSRTDYAAITEILNEVKTALAQNLNLTKEQKEEVTSACKLKVWDPKRTDYDNDAIRVDVLAHLKKHALQNGFKAFFDARTQARSKALNHFIGLQASYAKSIYRSHIKDTIKQCLTTATTTGMRKLVGTTDNISPLDALRMAIVRNYARNNKELLTKRSDENTNKCSRVGDSETIQRKDGDTWWPAVTKFLDDKNKEYGSTDLKSPGWANHISEIIAHERRSFPNDLIPLIPISQPSAGPSGAKFTFPSNGTVTGHQSGGFQLPPLQIPASSSAPNGFTLPSLAAAADGQAGPLLGSSGANKQNQSYEPSYSRAPFSGYQG